MTSLQFTTRQRYPVSLGSLWRACTQRAYPQRKYLALGARSVRLLAFKVEPRHVEVELERTLDLPLARLAGWLPEPLRGHVPESVVLHHQTRWWRTGPGTAKLDVKVAPAALPLRAEASGSLLQLSPDCTEMQMHWLLHCDLPWLADGALRLFEQQMRRALRRDHAFTLGWLRDAQADRAPPPD